MQSEIRNCEYHLFIQLDTFLYHNYIYSRMASHSLYNTEQEIRFLNGYFGWQMRVLFAF